MAYRETPSKEDLNRMLSEANREKEASAERVKELEAKLTSINTTIAGHERKVTHIDVTNKSPEKIERMLENKSELKKLMKFDETGDMSPETKVVWPTTLQEKPIIPEKSSSEPELTNKELLVIAGVAVISIMFIIVLGIIA